MKIVVLKLDFHDDKVKQKAMKTVAGLNGVHSIEVDTKDKKFTVIGDIDPMIAVAKLRKLCSTDIVTVMPIKESEKKGEPKKAGDDKKKDEGVKLNQFRAYPNNYQRQQPPIQAYLPPYMQHQHPIYYTSVEEETNHSCVIC